MWAPSAVRADVGRIPAWRRRRTLLLATPLLAGLLDPAGAVRAQTWNGSDSASGPFSSGTQNFHDSSSLNTAFSNTVTGGTQNLFDDSRVNASVAGAINGGQINLRSGSFPILATDATTSRTSLDFGGGSQAPNGNNTTIGRLSGSDGTISNNSSTASHADGGHLRPWRLGVRRRHHGQHGSALIAAEQVVAGEDRRRQADLDGNEYP